MGCPRDGLAWPGAMARAASTTDRGTGSWRSMDVSTHTTEKKAGVREGCHREDACTRLLPVYASQLRDVDRAVPQL